MKKILLTFITLTLLLSACAPAPAPTAAPAPAVTDPTPAPADPAANPKPTSAAPLTGNPTKKPKGKNQNIVPTSTSADMLSGVILGRPTNASIALSVIPARDSEISYAYGTQPTSLDARTNPQAAPAGAPSETTISGLQPNTRYYYQLFTNGSAAQTGSFITQRAPGSSFTFAIQGDSHPERVGNQFNSDLYNRTLQSVAANQPDFYIAIGDDFSVDNLKQVDPQTVNELYFNQRQWLGQVGAPLFLVNGNHEQASLANLDGTANNVAVWAQNARNSHFSQPAPDSFFTGDSLPVENIGLLRDYYAFTWGDALFVVIDPYWHSPQTVDNQFGASKDQKKNRDMWNITLGEVQYQWFKQTLETSSAAHKFVFTHHVLGTGRGGIEMATNGEWGDAANLAAHRPGWQQTIHQLMVDNHVSIFFQGHDHIFARQELDGVIYQSLPEPANPNYSWENSEAYKSGDKFPNSGHLRVTVSADQVNVEYIRSYLDKPDESAFSYSVP